MAEQIGLVLNTFEDNMVEVITDRKDACGGCEDTGKCRTCLTSARIVSTVRNPIGARQGDVVSIYLEESDLWTGAVSIYIVPILWLMTGAIMGSSMGGEWRIGETGAAMLLGLLGLTIGLIIIVIISKSLKLGSKMPPRIIRVVESGKEQAFDYIKSKSHLIGKE